MILRLSTFLAFSFLIFAIISQLSASDDILGCGGFVKSDIPINFSRIEIKLFTKQGALKYHTDCAPNNGYYLIPLYDKGEFILKVDPPAGWNFEPNVVKLQIDGQNDPCSQGKDINFYFKGFTINGKVISRGQSTGPNDVKIFLKQGKTNTVVQSTITKDNGRYSFSKVLPDSYIVSASHPKWKLDVSQIKIDVNDNVDEAADNLIISGYDVQGEVTSDGEPIQGVNFLLFSNVISQSEVRGCHKKVAEGFAEKDLGNYLCQVKSEKDGKFTFPVLVPGEYSIHPFYKGENIQFDVTPKKVNFHLKHEGLILSEKFKVQGFTVVGRVLAYTGGPGIPKARVFLNTEFNTETNSDGSFKFDSMKAGTYSVKVLKEKIYFDELQVRITPNTPHLPAIIAKSFDVCGQLLVSRLPTGLDLDARRMLLVESTDNPNKLPIKIRTENNGGFCTPLPPGQYVVKPFLAEAETQVGLGFQPEAIAVSVTHGPVLELNFKQFLAKVSGKIRSLGSNAGILVSLLPKVKGTVDAVTLTIFNKDAFTFESVLPGEYIVKVTKDEWCWAKSQIEITVRMSDVKDVEFVQEGYVMSVMSSHPTNLHYSERDGFSKGIYNIKQGSNTVCIAKSGIYDLVPEGCHLFTESKFNFVTEKPAVVVLQATHHLLTGSIQSSKNVTDITLVVTTTNNRMEDRKETITHGPLKATLDAKTKNYIYIFKLWVQYGDILQMEPRSGLVLFDPQSQLVTTVDGCMDNLVRFEAKMGLFVSGKVVPPLEDVEITLKSKRDDPRKGVLMKIKTDRKGQYSLGPLNSHEEYTVEAQKSGYVLTQRDKYDFGAFKLAEIVASVTGENGQGVQGVLLSLSGASDYRKNSLTLENGQMRFVDLEPGQYFLRPMLKEFSFDPPSTMVDVKEGMTVNIQLKGTRVAFSCYGNITSLTGEGEGGVTVEAVGINTCRGSQEEGTSEADGSFRIRGLLPNCRYQVRVKKTQEFLLTWERATPVAKTIEVEKSDVYGIHIIVFRRATQMEITGNIVTSPEHLSTVKAKLFKDDSDHVVHTVSMTHGSFFQFPFIPVDGRLYTLRLESTLPRSSYNYLLPQATIKANSSFRHVTLKFNPEPKMSDQDLHQGSYYTLPLVILILLITCSYKQLSPLSNNIVEMMHTWLNPVTSQEVVKDDANERRKKTKPRKI